MTTASSDRAARTVLALVITGLTAGALATDLPRLSKGEFWGDGATYYLMARSLAEDLDLRYEARDLFRARREFSSGPQGLFLKRAHGGLRMDPEGGFPWLGRVPPSEPRLYFAKAFAYPAVAAPFVRLFGTRGLLLTTVPLSHRTTSISSDVSSKIDRCPNRRPSSTAWLRVRPAAR